VGINLSKFSLSLMTQLSIAQIAIPKSRRFILQLELFLKVQVSTKQTQRQKNLINRDAAERRV
jgi:hypothetical protein